MPDGLSGPLDLPLWTQDKAAAAEALRGLDLAQSLLQSEQEALAPNDAELALGGLALA